MTNVAYADFGTQNEGKEVHMAELEEGYTKLANALLDTLLRADITLHQQKVMLAIIRKTYGFNKKRDRITNTQIAEMTGIPATRVCTAKNKLLERKFLLMDGNCIGVNKVISEWQTFPEKGNTQNREFFPEKGKELFPKMGNPQKGETFPETGNETFPKTGNDHSPKGGNTKETIQKKEINNKNILPEQVRSACEKNLTEPAQKNPVEEAFEKIFWCAGMVKTGKKKALSAFSSQFRMWRKETGGDAEEFACMLAEDIRSRLAGKQFGFDKLHPTTYLTGQRWMDEIAKPAEEMPKPKFDTRNFTEEQRKEWVLYELLEGR